MNPASDPTRDDDWLEAVLRADAADASSAYIADGGFTASVMARLPRPITLPSWRRPVVFALWALIGIAALLGLPQVFESVFQTLAGVVYAQRVTLAQAGIAMAALGALTWSTVAYVVRIE